MRIPLIAFAVGLSLAVANAENLPPVANFTFSPSRPTVRDVVEFVDHSVDPDGSVVSWLWYFGDGSSSTARNPKHIYTIKGHYLINLIVSDDQGATGMAYAFIDVVNLPPEADFIFSPGRPTIKDDIVFNDTSIDPDGPIVWWLWRFGDGSNSTSRDPVHRYESRGQYRVSLEVRDEDGLASVVERVVEVVNIPPEANFSFSPEVGRRDGDVLFTDLSTDHDGSVVSWIWDFGDGSKSDAQNPRHRYDSLGVFLVNLTVFDDEGTSGSLIRPLEVLNSPPVANFSFSPGRPPAGQPASFVDLSSDPDGSVVSWLWTFGDGAISTAQNPAHTYAERGIYLVVLNVTDSDGAQANASGYVRVIGVPPRADFSFSPSRPRVGEAITFSDASQDPDSGIFTWLWDFGDGSTSGLKTTKHAYRKAGRYYVNLTIWDDDGLPASVVKAVDVRAPWVLLAWMVVLLPIGALVLAIVVTWKRKGGARGKAYTHET